MNLAKTLAISSMLAAFVCSGQKVSGIYKTPDLLKRIGNRDTLFVVNFWATWCKPCVQELPAFDSLDVTGKKIKVLLVCLDFKEELGRKVNPFLNKKKIQSECILLDEVNGNDFVNQVSENWSGAIPATLFVKGGRKLLKEKKLNLKELQSCVKEFD